jgi:predicted nucleic acid-binding protein
LRPWFEDRILPVTEPIAERLGHLAGERDARGWTLPVADGLIAATALEHGLTLVTRNGKVLHRPRSLAPEPLGREGMNSAIS